MRLIWLFLAWMLIEIGLFASVGARFGVLMTWAVVLSSGLAGIWLIRWQKRSVAALVFQDLRSLGQALTPAAHSALIVLAAVLLILPGFLTDILGLVLLVPWVRNRIIDYLRDRARIAAMHPNVNEMLHPRQRSADIIDATAQVVPPASPIPNKPSGWTKP